jgi:hypothetical protein
MIIPKSGRDLERFLKFIVDTCQQSREERKALYARRRRYFLYGSADGTAVHNRLNAHLDLVASFLYSPDHAKFAVEPAEGAEDAVIEQTATLARYWNDLFRDSDLAYQYGDALLWSLVYEMMFIKLGFNEARGELYGVLVPPAAIGVYDEARPGLSNQPAFTHSYGIDFDEAVQRLYRAGLAQEIKRLDVKEAVEEEQEHSPLHSIVVGGAWGASITDPVQGTVNVQAEPTPSYAPAVGVPQCRWHEIYVWDDEHNDYAIFTMLEPDILLSDSRVTIEILNRANTGRPKPASGSNIFLPGEHPFIPVQPYGLFDYFWGVAHIERLIPLQNWTEKRIGEIRMLLARQVNPARFGSGIMGLTDEVMAAMSGPGGWAFEQIPGAKIEELKPDIPPDLFAELKEINNMFLEASGLTQTLQGHGEAGVRGSSHARRLAITGSGRIRKVAIALEPSLAKLGELAIRLIMRNCDDKLRTARGAEFVPAQVPADFRIRVSGHSHSPLFRDETKDDAIVMLKARAIDQESLIDILNPPNAQELKVRLRKRQQLQMQLLREAAARGEDGGKRRSPLKVVS